MHNDGSAEGQGSELRAAVGRWPAETSGNEILMHRFVCRATTVI